MEYSDETNLDVAYKIYKGLESISWKFSTFYKMKNFRILEDCAHLRAKLLKIKVPDEFLVVSAEVFYNIFLFSFINNYVGYW